MTKTLSGTLALFAASPAFAHVSAEAPIHMHGYETLAMGIGAIVIAACVWRFGKGS